MKIVLRIGLAVLALPLVGSVVFFATGPSAEERAADLLDAQVQAWVDPDTRARTDAALRADNPEWDFMRRTFLVLAAAGQSLEHPGDPDWVTLIDDVIDDTLDHEARQGHRSFLLPYGGHRPFLDPQGRSLFVDGEIGLMLGVRRILADDSETAVLHRERVATLVAAFDRSPVGLPESYPDEAWAFCVTNALVAIHLADLLDGTDHSDVVAHGVTALSDRAEANTGLIGSSFRYDGQALDGPEGSSLWLVAVNLQLLDPELAQLQYEGAREGLVHGLFGLSWASEWGAGWRGPGDIDSGPVVPLVDASPSSSGFALMAAAAFDDAPTLRRLQRSLRAADAVLALDPRFRRMVADNPMGDVVLLHALTFGPLWDEIRDRQGATSG